MKLPFFSVSISFLIRLKYMYLNSLGGGGIMNKLEIKRILINDTNARITYDLINGEIILLSSEGSEVDVFGVPPTF